MDLGKRGFELSINFIVILIIAVVIFAGGTMLMYRIFGETNKFKDSVDQDSQARIESLLDQGQHVVIPDTDKSVARGDSVSFALGISNIGMGDLKLFYITVTQQTTNPTSNPLIQTATGKVLPLYRAAPQYYAIDNNAHKAVPIIFEATPDAPVGTYIFQIDITEDANPPSGTPKQYDYPQKVYVHVQ